MACLDPFLNPWDERYHALVARNMMGNPFKPMLIKKYLDEVPQYSWDTANIWLHKQPLFLWQMALSMKIFGVHEVSMRLPSVLIGTISVWLLYKIALIITDNKTIAFMAGLFFCFAYFQLAQINGRLSVDHADVAFCFYVLASIYSYFKYVHSKQKNLFVVLIGVTAACAILCKWLTGLLVFLLWGVQLLQDIIKHKKYNQLQHFLVAIFICAALVLPWQIYILNSFTELAQYEYAYNSRHFTEAIEGHDGGADFYFNNLDYVFGDYVWALLIPGLLFVLANKKYRQNFYILNCLAALLIIHLFFTLAATKMHAYVFCVYPFLFLFLAICLYHIFHGFKYKIVALSVCSVFICAAFLRYGYIEYYTVPSAYRDARINNTVIYKNLRQHIPKNINHVFNVQEKEFIDLMFYNADVHAWFTKPDSALVNKYAEDGIKIAAFNVDGQERMDTTLDIYVPQVLLKYAKQ
jgi:4-amino-4-deoxy-L-arabinose transferase-like glycosyltransferase